MLLRQSFSKEKLWKPKKNLHISFLLWRIVEENHENNQDIGWKEICVRKMDFLTVCKQSFKISRVFHKCFLQVFGVTCHVVAATSSVGYTFIQNNTQSKWIGSQEGAAFNKLFKTIRKVGLHTPKRAWKVRSEYLVISSISNRRHLSPDLVYHRFCYDSNVLIAWSNNLLCSMKEASMASMVT